MSEEKAKRIHIEDGNAEAEKAKEKAEAEEAAEAVNAEAEKAADTAAAAEETADAEAEEAAKAEPETEGKAGETDAEAEGRVGETDAEAEGGAGESEEAVEAKEAAPSAEEQESERYMRLMAEFQNFKRRAAKEKSDIHAFANERIVSDLLPVLDNFERALNTETDDIEAYAKGIQLIFEQLKTALEKAGVKEIEAEGKEFDPNVHSAVMTQPSTTVEDGKICMVLQKGYMLNDKVVRPSMVAVAKNE